MGIRLDQQETKNPDRIKGKDRLCWPTKGKSGESTAQRFSSSTSNPQLKMLSLSNDLEGMPCKTYDLSVNIEMEFQRRIFNKAVMWGMLGRSPFDRGKGLFYKNTLKRERALTEDEVKRLIDACSPRLKPIVITAVYTGLRKRGYPLSEMEGR